jgi:hypothetical protein
MKFYDCKVWLVDGETGLRVNQVAKKAIPACEVILLRRLHADQLSEVKEVTTTDEKKLKRTSNDWRDYLRANGYSRRLIEREFDRAGPLPATLERPRRPSAAAARHVAEDEDDFGMADAATA